MAASQAPVYIGGIQLLAAKQCTVFDRVYVHSTRFTPPPLGMAQVVQPEVSASHGPSSPVVVLAKCKLPPVVAVGQATPPLHPIGPLATMAKYERVEAKVEVMENIWLVAPPTRSRVVALHPEGVQSIKW